MFTTRSVGVYIKDKAQRSGVLLFVCGHKPLPVPFAARFIYVFILIHVRALIYPFFYRDPVTHSRCKLLPAIPKKGISCPLHFSQHTTDSQGNPGNYFPVWFFCFSLPS